MVAKLLAVLQEASFGLKKLRNDSKGHPVHCLVVEERLDHDELIQASHLLELESSESLSEVPQHVVIEAQLVKEDEDIFLVGST